MLGERKENFIVFRFLLNVVKIVCELCLIILKLSIDSSGDFVFFISFFHYIYRISKLSDL